MKKSLLGPYSVVLEERRIAGDSNQYAPNVDELILGISANVKAQSDGPSEEAQNPQYTLVTRK